MREPQQGEIWWARLPSPHGRRPVLVLTRSAALPVLTNVTVAPLTRTKRHPPAEVALGPRDDVPTACVVSLENILTIRKASLDKAITQLSGEKMTAVFSAIRYALDIP